MKRIVVTALSFSMVITLAACGNDKPTELTEDTEISESTEVKEETKTKEKAETKKRSLKGSTVGSSFWIWNVVSSNPMRCSMPSISALKIRSSRSKKRSIPSMSTVSTA